MPEDRGNRGNRGQNRNRPLPNDGVGPPGGQPGGGDNGGGNGGGNNPPPPPPPVTPPPLLPPQAYTPGQDLFFGNAGTFSPPLDRRQNYFRPFATQFPDVIGFELLVQDLSGGLGVVTGPFSQFNDRSTKNTNDTRVPGVLRLNPITKVETGADAENDRPMSHQNLHGYLWIAQGGNANAALFENIASTDWDPTAVTYTPGSDITNLAAVVIGGVTVERRLAICKVGGAVDIADVSAGAAGFTVDGTMHASTNPCWGILQTFLNTQTMLIYANNLIYTLAASAAIGDAPTSTGTVLQNGGFAISIKKLGDAPYRAFFAVPSQTSAVSVQAGGTPGRYTIVHTNLEGTDPQDLKMRLPYIRGVADIEQGLAYTDGPTVYLQTDTQNALNLGFGRGREPATSRDWIVQNLYGFQNRLFAGVLYRESGRPNSWWIEEFDFRSRQWHQCTLTYATTDDHEFGVGPSSPVFEDTVFGGSYYRLYAHSDTEWRHVQMAPQDVDPYLFSRSPFIDYQFAATGSTETPAWLLPGYEGYPISVGEIRFLGDPTQGGTAAKVGITPAIQTASGYSFTAGMLREFHNADRWSLNVARYPDNIDLVQRLKLKIDLTRGSDVNDSPDGVPFIIRGYVHLSGEARRPVEIEPQRYRHV